MYHFGQGVKKDPVEAAKWYRKAVDGGFADAMAALAVMYVNGDGVTKNHPEAERLFARFADCAKPGQLYAMGLEFSRGRRVKKDRVKAAEWFTKAVAAGSVDAMWNRSGCCSVAHGSRPAGPDHAGGSGSRSWQTT